MFFHKKLQNRYSSKKQFNSCLNVTKLNCFSFKQILKSRSDFLLCHAFRLLHESRSEALVVPARRNCRCRLRCRGCLRHGRSRRGRFRRCRGRRAAVVSGAAVVGTAVVAAVVSAVPSFFVPRSWSSPCRLNGSTGPDLPQRCSRRWSSPLPAVG